MLNAEQVEDIRKRWNECRSTDSELTLLFDSHLEALVKLAECDAEIARLKSDVPRKTALPSTVCKCGHDKNKHTDFPYRHCREFSCSCLVFMPHEEEKL